MLRLFVDSGSSITQEEKEKYNVEIIPLKILIGGKEYLDGVDLPYDVFYHELIENKGFPKTSLPSLVDVEDKVNEYTKAGDDVLIITISSGISGTYNAMRVLFQDNEKVRVIDSKSAVGGVRILVDEVNRHRDETLNQLEARLNEIIPRIHVMAIPETLNYLLRGGRLSRTEWLIGTALKLKPIIGLQDGNVKALAKTIGLKRGMLYIVDALNKFECDPNHEIIASYTYNKDNIDQLVKLTDEKYLPQIQVYDDLDPAIACHWGPNAFGYIFVGKK